MPAAPIPSPFISMWFGNFFEPFYSDADAVRKGIADVAALGFNSVNLDSKPWEDFFARYQGESASQYVATQELMMSEAAKHGLDYTCLALYLCGDNLYPNIRDVPPVWGEQAVLPDGQPMGTYKYWSPAAQATMVDHVAGLLRLYGGGMRRTNDGKIVMQTMFDPIAKPSFDEEGRKHYLDWLTQRYNGDLGELSNRYRINAMSFESLRPEDYWLRPEELNWVGCALPTAADFAAQAPDFHRWVDNQTYLGEVLVNYFATMREHWQAMDPQLFVEPVLHQWGYFFNPPAQPDWQTGQRALDVYRLAKHVDSVLFIAAPLNAENRPDATVLGVESAIARTANEGRPFTGGLYLGRHINEDVYRTVPPAEAIATQVAGGAQRLHTYGYSGLDDGGVLFRMDDVFKDSLRQGTRWAAEVMPLLQQPRKHEVAILFPAAMSFYEPLELDENGRRRMDLLGWYQQLTDLGWHADILHPDQVAAGALQNYQHLVVPTDSLYGLFDTSAAEAAIRGFVEAGGTMMHGAGCKIAKRVFGISEEAVEFDCIRWQEDLIPHGWSTSAFTSAGENVGSYIGSGQPAILRTPIGRGKVLSFGFEYGYAYSRQTMPIVPPAYGKSEMHPLVLLERTPIEAEIGTSPSALMPPVRGVETVIFGNSAVIVNHRASPVDISAIPARRHIPMIPAASGWLAAHSAAYIEL